MRKLFLYIFTGLIFCNIGNTNDIHEYEIEGISIGDSLLEYINEKEIVKEIQVNKFVYKNLSDVFGEVYLFDNFKEYDTLSFFVKSRDKNYNIYSISGNINYNNKFEECLNKQKEVDAEFSNIFPNAKKEYFTHKIDVDPSGKSISQNIVFFFESGDNIQVNCTKYKTELKNQYNWVDSFMIALNTKEITDWFDNPIN